MPRITFRITGGSAWMLALAVQTAGAQATNEWTAYGRDAFGGRFSPLTQITRDNVTRLEIAWTYRTGERDVLSRQEPKLEATPLFVDGTLYLSTPLGKVVALDPATGRERWKFDAKADPDQGRRLRQSRGVHVARLSRTRRRHLPPADLSPGDRCSHHRAGRAYGAPVHHLR